MSLSQSFVDLSRLSAGRSGDEHALDEALELVRSATSASEVWFVYAGDNDFRHTGTGPLELKPAGLWIINRALTSRDGIVTFVAAANRVADIRAATPRSVTEREYVAALIPTPGSTAQMVIARGPWQEAEVAAALDALAATLPSLALILHHYLDLSYALKERNQLNALMSITRIMSQSEDIEVVLTSIARTIAAVAGIGYVSIDIVNRSGEVETRAVNYRLRTAADSDSWKEGRRRADPIREEVMRTRRPLLFADAQNDDRLPERSRSFFRRVLIRSTAVFPLVVKDEMLGVVSFAAQRPLEFDGPDIELFEGLALQIATATKAIHLYRDLAESQEALEEKSGQLKRALAVEREHARRDALTGALNHGAITQELQAAMAASPDGPIALVMADVDGMKAVNDTYGHVFGDRVLLATATALDRDGALVGRYGGDEFLVVLPRRDLAYAERYREQVLAAVAENPIPVDGSRSAIPVNLSLGVAMYPEEASAIADLIAASDSSMYASKWERMRARGYSASRDVERTARIMEELVPLLTTTGALSDKLELVCGRLSTAGRYDAVDCQLFEWLDGAPAIRTTRLGSEDLNQRWLDAQPASMERAYEFRRAMVASRRPIILDDLQQSVSFSDSERSVLADSGIRSAVVAPMFWREELIGILAVGRAELGAFTPEDAQFIMQIANQVTAIVSMASMVEQLQSTSDMLAESHAETVMMLAAAAEAHDRTTGQHLRSIRSLTEALAGEMNYSEAAVRELGLAATLHDIGKISVPDAILSSSVNFRDGDFETQAMWEVMKQHSVWGAEFLQSRGGFELAAKVARWHHERWDGRGYPDGLTGSELPEAVTIVTVADALDAMTSDRPYRAGRPMSEAVREIEECAGKQFNPRVVQALVALHGRGALQRPHDHGERAQLAA